MAKINLADCVGQKILATHRTGEMVIDTVLHSTINREYPYLFGGYLYTQDGRANTLGRHRQDIIFVRTPGQFTLLEWITDRQPTKKDSWHGRVNCIDERGIIYAVRNTITATKWAHCPGWKPPEPEPDPRQAEIDALRQTLAECQEKLNELGIGSVVRLDREDMEGGND